MPNLASRNQAGTTYDFSESTVGENGPVAMADRLVSLYAHVTGEPAAYAA